MLMPMFTKTVPHDVFPTVDPSRSELSTYGKVILITRGDQGIGATIVRDFAKAGGSDIVIMGRKQETLSAIKAEIESLPSTEYGG